MKYIHQMTIILLYSLIGELLNVIIPLPVPASVYGMLLLLISLLTGLVKLPAIEETADFLVAVMPLFFISPTVSIMTNIGTFKNELLQLLVMCILSTIGVLVVTAEVAQLIIKRGKKRQMDSFSDENE